jgi:hypothetical protein
MADNHHIKTIADGTKTLETTSGITVDDGSGNQTGGSGSVDSGTRIISTDTKTQIVGEAPSGIVTVAAAIVTQNKQYCWVAEA